MQTLIPHRSGLMSPAGVADAYAWPDDDQPFVRALMVATADGAARSPKGLSGGISSAGDRLVFGTVRGLSDVILVGAQTVRSEQYGPQRERPELAARREQAGQAPTPRIAIVTRSGELDVDAPLFTESQQAPLIFAPRNLPEAVRARLDEVAEVVTFADETVPLPSVVEHLSRLQLHRIVCEGGPSLLGEIASCGLLNEVCLTVTPLLAGGSYPGQATIPRILAGPALPEAPQDVELVHILEDGGTLFLRYALR